MFSVTTDIAETYKGSLQLLKSSNNFENDDLFMSEKENDFQKSMVNYKKTLYKQKVFTIILFFLF